MPGGLLNIVAYGNQNIILNGNPSKTFYKCVYAKYTNFGLQKISHTFVFDPSYWHRTTHIDVRHYTCI